MQNAIKVFALLAALGSACQKKPPANEQNLAMDQAVPDNATLANADIEALPADESSGTSSNELAAGEDNPDVNDLNASGNSH